MGTDSLNVRGEVDGYARKTFGSLLLPCVNFGVALLMGLLPWADPKLARYDSEVRASLSRTVRIPRLLLTGFLAAIALCVLAVAVGLFRNSANLTT